MSGRKRAAFTLVELLVVVAIISLLLAILLPAVQSAREASRRRQCTTNLQQQVLATLNYESQNRELPTGSREHKRPNAESVGWRLLVLPYMEGESTYAAVPPNDEGGYDGDKRTRPPSIFYCPSVERQPDSVEFPQSDYEGVAGAGATDDGRRDLEDLGCGDVYTDGVFYPKSDTRISDITDGTSHTLAIGERTYILHVWTDGSYWFKNPQYKVCMRSTRNVRWPLGADHSRYGYYVGDPEAPAGAAKTMLLNDLEFDSSHPDVVPFAMADGSVHVIDESIDLSVLRELATRNGHEINRWEP
ncbi:MAG: DUF1559 domain-containing protein [Pirellulales bacterium]